MFPNPQDALPLPPRPNLEQYKKQAKDLVKACQSGEAEAVRGWAAKWIKRLADLQRPPIASQLRRGIDRSTDEVEEFARRKLSKSALPGARPALADAQFVIARAHGFESWPKLATHIVALARRTSPVSKFESAADAIITGDVATLESLLRKDPELIRARSTREHRATLLHYVSANGVEGFRQQTPKNAVKVAEVLLEAGAEVDAGADVYGGAWPTLGLVATSAHPLRAGVQEPLMEILLEHGAAVDGAPRGRGLVIECLANGCPGAAEFLARRGAPLDLEGAAGVGRLDVVKGFFREDGSLKANVKKSQVVDGFMWACGCGRTTVVDFLLRTSIKTDACRHGETGLHSASYGGHVDVVKLLLERKTPVNIKDETHDGTPLWWALYGWRNPPFEAEHASYYEIVALLVAAGAKVDPEWLEKNMERRIIVEKARADPRMRAALGGEKPRK